MSWRARDDPPPDLAISAPRVDVGSHQSEGSVLIVYSARRPKAPAQGAGLFAAAVGDGRRGDHEYRAVGVLDDGMGDAPQQ